MKFSAEPSKTAHVLRLLEREISSGALPAGSCLRSTRDLAAQFAVSSMVIRSAFEELERKNLIRRRPRGVATVVGGKSILIVDRPEFYGQDYQAEYIQAEFCAVCRERNVRVDRLGIEFLRSANAIELTGGLCEKRYAGVLLCGSGYRGGEPELGILRALNVPVLQPGSSHLEESNVTGFTVMPIERERAMLTALRCLRDSGYERIGLIVGKDFGVPTVPELTRSLRATGWPVVAVTAIPSSDWRSGEAGGFVGDGSRFDAVLCHSDLLALAVYDHCRAARIAIPERLGVMSFRRVPGGAFLRPALATIDPQYELRGRCAAEFLLDGKLSEVPQILIPGDSVKKLQEVVS